MSYFPLLKPGKVQFLKNLVTYTFVLHHILKNVLNNILTKSFFLSKNFSSFYVKNHTLSIDFYVKLTQSYLSILKYLLKNHLV